MYFLTLIIADLFTTTWIYLHVIDWFESVIDRQGTITLIDLQLHFKDEKYWSTLVSYCLVNGYYAHASFRSLDW
jgi:hypothetical protein